MNKITSLALTLFTATSLVFAPAFSAQESAPTSEAPSSSSETDQDIAAYEEGIQLGYGMPFILGMIGTAGVVGAIVAIVADSSSSHSHSHS